MKQKFPFKNPPLPYAYEAMEPFIDAKTMELHHDRHLQTYVDNLNAALKDYPEYHGFSLEELLIYIQSLPEEIREKVKNNAGGVYSHILYFENLANPPKKELPQNLGNAIRDSFGSEDAFLEKLSEAAMSVFGSGYAWLVLDALGKLKIMTSANQDTPLSENLYPILNVDVWEHAYYLKHYNKRADYIKDWSQIINWENAGQRYTAFFENVESR